MADRGAHAGDRSDHQRHDLVLVAAAADRGGRLAGMLEACADCRSLLGDLRALAAAVPMSAIPPRPRDLRLTRQDVARLRRGGWRRWLAAIGTGRDAVTRPLAMSLTTLGLAGLLLSAIPAGLPLGGTASDLGGVESVAHPLRSDGGDALSGAGGVAVPTMVPAAHGPDDGMSEAPAGASDGLAVRMLAIAFLGAGLAIAGLRQLAAVQRRMR